MACGITSIDQKGENLLLTIPEFDFEKVIDAKYREWHGSAKMAKYLRPETLFGTKFDSYLNESDEGGAAIRIDTPEWYKRVKEEGIQEEEASAELIKQFEEMKRSM